MRDILAPIAKWWDAGETFGLATVVRTFSSAPREPGAALAVSAGGEVVGSVSGGCVEGAVYELAGEVSPSGPAVLQTYGISDNAAESSTFSSSRSVASSSLSSARSRPPSGRASR